MTCTFPGGNDPKLMPTRCFVGCWWLFSVVIVAAYGGSLYSFLTINLNYIPFETGEEMIRSNYKWGTTGGSFYVTELQVQNVKTNPPPPPFLMLQP